MVNTFTQAPTKQISRTMFDLSFDRKMTATAGRLYPIYCEEILPHDTFSIDPSSLARMATPIHPVMDNAFMDVAFFYVPSRIIWDNFTKFMGEPPNDPYDSVKPLSVPRLIPQRDEDTLEMNLTVPKSVLDYFALPTRANLEPISALPMRAFSKIWNDWYMGETVMKPIDIDTSDSDGVMFNTKSRSANDMYMDNDPEAYIFTTPYGGHLPPVAKYHDYFTSSLVDAQRGEDVAIPLNGFAPLVSLDSNGMLTNISFVDAYGSSDVNGTLEIDNGDLNVGASDYLSFGPNNFANLSGVGNNPLGSANAYATINDLRYAFATQQLLEIDNLYGSSRYTELLYGHFGVTAPSGLLQRSEFLFGKQIPVSITQVLQTSETTENSPQGNTAAFSLTTDVSNGFTKSFYEHGYVIGVMCIRNESSYQQMVHKTFSRFDRLDYFWREFEGTGDEPIFGREIYNGTVSDLLQPETEVLRRYQESVFGYQERYASYKYHPNEVTGEFRSNYPGGSLDVWHYADYYTSPPYLSTEWLRASRENIDRTLAVSSDVSDQFIIDFYFKVRATRPMAKYSRPGGLYSRI